MNELMKIAATPMRGQVVDTVNARDLHGFLGSADRFADWIKNRIEKYGFVEHEDYEIVGSFGENEPEAASDGVFRQIPKNPQGGRPQVEYALSLDMAKEMAMVERNERGREARKYFIECERRLKAGDLQRIDFSEVGGDQLAVLDYEGHKAVFNEEAVWLLADAFRDDGPLARFAMRRVTRSLVALGKRPPAPAQPAGPSMLEQALIRGVKQGLTLAATAGECKMPLEALTRLIRYRKMGMTQGEAAGAFGMQPSTVQNVERKLKAAGIRIDPVRTQRRDKYLMEHLDQIVLDGPIGPAGGGHAGQ